MKSKLTLCGERSGPVSFGMQRSGQLIHGRKTLIYLWCTFYHMCLILQLLKTSNSKGKAKRLVNNAKNDGKL